MNLDQPDMSQDFTGLSLDPGGEYHEPPPPAPEISSEGIVALDITEQFKAAVKTLRPGELVKDGFFTLFEAVGALEIMDSKMDSGCLAPGEPLIDDYDLSRSLLPAEVIGIIDQLLCLEMAWHLGYPLSQTLFTSVYIEGINVSTPTSIAEADFLKGPEAEAVRSPLHDVLRAYCLGLLKTCWYVVNCIKFEHFYEEEDFVTNTYHRSLLDVIERDDIRDVIQDVRATIHNLRHTLTADMALALDSRLELRYAFLRAIELTDLRGSPEPLKTPWVQMKAILDNVAKTHHLATPVPEAFSTKLQRRLASTMPPRPIVQLSFDDACTRWQRLFEDGIEATDIFNYVDSQNLLNFVVAFQSKKPQPVAYMRTLLQSYIIRDNIVLGNMSIRQIMDVDLATIVLPCSPLLDPANDDIEAVHSPRFAMAHQMETFRMRAAHAYLDTFRAFCQNRSRIRRTLCHSIQDWDNVQLDAEEIDQLLQIQLDEKPLHWTSSSSATDPSYALSLSSWVYFYKLRLMEWIVQLGFELEVYQPDELAGMYWYLSYLAKKRAQHIERIKAFTVKALNHQRSRLNPEAAAAKVFSAAKEAMFTRSLTFLRAAMLDAAVTWELADALSCLYAVLYRLRLLKPLPRPYSTDELRYEIRMKPFATIGLPELPSFAHFSRATSHADRDVLTVLDCADKAIAGAKKGFEVLSKFDETEAFTAGSHERWKKATKDCLKSVIYTGIAIANIRKAVERVGEDGDLQLKASVPAPGEGYHDWWRVPVVEVIR